ncbi:MAG: energy transducer TonB [Taibaiella sp.]|nr:energy transducer TonB [Taibaiella sp.]
MDKQMLLQADYLDIIFDGRNKTYGGYQLRRDYGDRLRNAGAIMFLAVLGLVALVGFERPVEHSNVLDIAGRVVDLTDVLLPPPAVAAPPPPPKTVQSPPPPVPAMKFTEPVLTNEPIEEKETMPEASNMKGLASGAGNEGDSAAIGIGNEGNIGAVGRTMGAEKKPELPRTFVEQMPTFNGDLNSYLAAHVHYPEAAREAGVEGRVVVEFIVDEHGAVTNARVAKGIGGGCDEEALRVISGMPHWKAGKQNGAPVKVLFNVAVKFVLQ